MAEKIANRTHAVASAGYWFRAARDAQMAGAIGDALLFMENAYNHAEGALVALRREHGLPLSDEPAERDKVREKIGAALGRDQT
jgi:hypothetical protein